MSFLTSLSLSNEYDDRNIHLVLYLIHEKDNLYILCTGCHIYLLILVVRWNSVVRQTIAVSITINGLINKAFVIRYR